MQIDYWTPLAGLALFLLAMSIIEHAIRALAGDGVRSYIRRNTGSPVKGVLSGTLATALLQSSSLVGLLVLAFVGAGIMRLKDALLVIFGSNLGTTITGWIVATIGFKLNLEAASLPLIAIGGMIGLVLGHAKIGSFGRLILGLGLLLLALQFLKSAVSDVEALIAPTFFAQLSLWQFLLLGVLFSAVMQSSSAVMVITLSALNSGMIDLYAAAAVMVGADFGTTTTIVFGAVGGSGNKKRVALGQVLFNMTTDLLAYILLIPLVSMLGKLLDPLVALVAFHTTFNLMGVCIWTPNTTRFAEFLERRFVNTQRKIGLKLDRATQLVADTALPALRRELEAMVQWVLLKNRETFSKNDSFGIPSKCEFTRHYEVTKAIESDVLEFTLGLDVSQYTSQQKGMIEKLLTIARNLLLSSKFCKDCLNDLHELAECDATLFGEIVNVQVDFYNRCAELDDCGVGMDLEKIEELFRITNAAHDALHEKIYAEIKLDRLPSNAISSVLNVNRSLHSSNLAFLTSLSSFARFDTVTVS